MISPVASTPAQPSDEKPKTKNTQNPSFLKVSTIGLIAFLSLSLLFHQKTARRNAFRMSLPPKPWDLDKKSLMMSAMRKNKTKKD